jgi:ribonuclease P protein component
MLDRAHRLTTGREFAAAIRHGRRAGSSTVVLHLAVDAGAIEARRAPAPSPRIGLVVGKAVGNAVVRNRVKRRLRHLVRDRLPLLPDGVTVVVRALPPSGGASSRRLAADLDRTLQRTLGPGERP